MVLIDTSSPLVAEYPTQQVQVWDANTGFWDPVPHLWCDQLQLAANAYDTAVLRYELGDVLQPGEITFAQYTPLSLLGRYVRVIIDQPNPLDDIVWVGAVTGDSIERSGVRDDGGTNKLTGRTQLLTAVGLEYFLDRDQVDTAMIQVDVLAQPTRIERALVFNGGTGSDHDNTTRTRANRAELLDANFKFSFASGVERELWSADDIVEHVLFYHGPRDTAGNMQPTSYELSLGGGGILGAFFPRVPSDRKTAFQILNEICAPERGLLWWAEPDYDAPNPFSSPIVIRVATSAAANVALPNGGTLFANSDQVELEFDTQTDVDYVEIQRDLSRRYHQVIVRGERMTSTFTVGLGDGTLTEDWTAGSEQDYKDAAAIVMDPVAYAALPEEEKAGANDALRREEKFYRVYAAFRIPPDWDGLSGDGFAAEKDFAIPEISSLGSVTGGKPLSVYGLRLMTTTRLIRGANYADLDDIDDPTTPGSEPEFTPAFAIVRVIAGDEEEDSKYQFADKLSDVGFDGLEPAEEITTSYHLHVQQSCPGVVLRSSGGLGHTLALNHWGSAEPSRKDPEVDYETLRVTITAEADAYCEARWPATNTLPAGEPLQRLTIYAGREFRLDYLAQNTVVGLANGEPVLATGGVLRDDRPELQTLARIAYQWYGLTRQPLSLTFRNVKNVFRLGQLITTIGDGTTQETVNTVVNRITYDFRQAEGNPTATMTVQTQKDDLDFVDLIS